MVNWLVILWLRQWQWWMRVIWLFLFIPQFPQYCLVTVPNLVCNEFFYITYSEAVVAFKLLWWLITVDEMQSKNWWPSTDHLTLQQNLCGRSGKASTLIFTGLVSFIFLQIGSLNQILSFVPMWTEAPFSLWPHHTQTRSDTRRRKKRAALRLQPHHTQNSQGLGDPHTFVKWASPILWPYNTC